MNTLVHSALSKLIQDDTFRTELEKMLDDVNRASSDLVSREQADPPDKSREEDLAVAKFSDIKEELLSDTAFLKLLVDALMSASTPDEERAKKDAKLLEQLTTLSRTVGELSATINEHDKVLIDMAEKAVIQESTQPVLLRARGNDAPATPEATTSLENRAARVLVKMGAKDA